MKLLYVETGHAPSLRITEKIYFFYNNQRQGSTLKININVNSQKKIIFAV